MIFATPNMHSKDPATSEIGFKKFEYLVSLLRNPGKMWRGFQVGVDETQGRLRPGELETGLKSQGWLEEVDL